MSDLFLLFINYFVFFNMLHLIQLDKCCMYVFIYLNIYTSFRYNIKIDDERKIFLEITVYEYVYEDTLVISYMSSNT